MKKFICVLSALTLLASSSVSAAKIDSVKPDMENKSLIISGSLEKSGLGSYKVTYQGSGTPYYENLGEFETNEDGTFMFEVPIVNTDKNFTIHISGETLTEEKATKELYFPDADEFRDYAQKLISGELDLKSALSDDEISKKILIDTKEYKKIKDSEKMLGGLKKYLSEKASVEKWDEFVDMFNTLCAMNIIGQAGSSSEAEKLLEDYSAYVKLSNASSYATYSADYFKDGYKAAVLAAFIGNTYGSTEDFYNKFNDAVILNGVEMVSNWAYASKPITENPGCVKDADVSGYNALNNYKGDVDKLIANKHFATIADLVSAFNSAVASVSGSIGKEPSGGGGGGVISGTGSTMPGNNANTVPGNTSGSAGFNDISNVSWASDAIVSLCGKNIINGYGDNTFKPNNSITREEFVKIIVTAFGYSIDTDAYNAFSDLSSANWAYPYIMTAVKNGIISGVSVDKFGMGEKITRQEMAVILYRAVTKGGYNIVGGADIKFTDYDKVSAWAADAVETMAKGAIVSGFDDGSFRPAECSTRAQAAVVVYKTLANIGLL